MNMNSLEAGVGVIEGGMDVIHEAQVKLKMRFNKINSVQENQAKRLLRLRVYILLKRAAEKSNTCTKVQSAGQITEGNEIRNPEKVEIKSGEEQEKVTYFRFPESDSECEDDSLDEDEIPPIPARHRNLFPVDLGPTHPLNFVTQTLDEFRGRASELYEAVVNLKRVAARLEKDYSKIEAVLTELEEIVEQDTTIRLVSGPGGVLSIPSIEVNSQTETNIGILETSAELKFNGPLFEERIGQDVATDASKIEGKNGQNDTDLEETKAPEIG